MDIIFSFKEANNYLFSIENTKFEDYTILIGAAVDIENIIAASCISNNRVCIY